MNVNNSFVSVNALKELVFNKVKGVEDTDTYRVVLRDAIDGYRTNENGERVATKVISYLVPRKVFMAQVFDKLPLLAEIYKKSLDKIKTEIIENLKQQFGNIEENDTDKQLKFENTVEDATKVAFEKYRIDFIKTLNLYLADGKIELKLIYHAAGEVETLDDGSVIDHKVDKHNIEFVDIAYGTIGKSVLDAINAKRAAKAMAIAKDLLDLDDLA